MTDSKAAYRERNREELRRKGREYAQAKRRAAGIPEQGSPESSENRRRARKLKGADHARWKGEAVGYFGLHTWVARSKTRTGICEVCGSRPNPTKDGKSSTEWANLSGEYRRDLTDWAEMCRSCHRRYDLTEEKIERLRELNRQPRVISNETREKLRQAALRRWASRHPAS